MIRQSFRLRLVLSLLFVVFGLLASYALLRGASGISAAAPKTAAATTPNAAPPPPEYPNPLPRSTLSLHVQSRSRASGKAHVFQSNPASSWFRLVPRIRTSTLPSTQQL